MSKTLSFKGYTGSIETDVENECLYGKLLFINDVVTYEAIDVAGLKAEFNIAVEDYIETCKIIGKEPEKPFKGSLNVRISPQNHRQLAIKAAGNGSSINDEINKAIDSYLLSKISRNFEMESSKIPIKISDEFTDKGAYAIYQISTVAAHNYHESKVRLVAETASRPVKSFELDFNLNSVEH